MFKQTARLWAHVYAGAPVSSPEYTKKIENLCAMGFDRVSINNLNYFSVRAEQVYVYKYRKSSASSESTKVHFLLP